eukprot:2984042-Amphidinium_carterae.1
MPRGIAQKQKVKTVRPTLLSDGNYTSVSLFKENWYLHRNSPPESLTNMISIVLPRLLFALCPELRGWAWHRPQPPFEVKST